MCLTVQSGLFRANEIAALGLLLLVADADAAAGHKPNDWRSALGARYALADVQTSTNNNILQLASLHPVTSVCRIACCCWAHAKGWTHLVAWHLRNARHDMPAPNLPAR